MVDIGRLFSLQARWLEVLPTVQPFYAVKCNDDRLLLKTMAAMGFGFDCASKVNRKYSGRRVEIFTPFFVCWDHVE